MRARILTDLEKSLQNLQNFIGIFSPLLKLIFLNFFFQEIFLKIKEKKLFLNFPKNSKKHSRFEKIFSLALFSSPEFAQTISDLQSGFRIVRIFPDGPDFFGNFLGFRISGFFSFFGVSFSKKKFSYIFL